MQKRFENIFCVVDLHAITAPQEPETLKAKIRELAALLIATGIEPEKSAIFIQSHISAHAELAWILSCITPYGRMHRMTQFKEKSHMIKQGVSVGLFIYPVLMAADILLYNTHLVPVGEDQKQHLEFARDIAERFNTIYGKTFRIPEPFIPETDARIMGLDNPLKKMSKSEQNSGHAIRLLDSPDDIRSKIMKAQTDSLKEIRFNENRPGIHNLLVIYELLTGAGRQAIEDRFEDRGYHELKKELAEVVIESLRPIQLRYSALMEDTHHIDDLLLEGAAKVRPIAERTITRVKNLVGLG